MRSAPVRAPSVGPLHEAIERELRAARVPGCSAALVRESGTVWSAGFGYADLRTRRPAEAATVYHLFSGTKLFTAAAVLQLAERGLLALDDPLSRFFPEHPQIADVRIVQLLSHASGLRDALRSFLAVRIPPDAMPDSAGALARYRFAFASAPGERVAYRNVNYALLGDLVTRVAGVEYRDYVAREILAPLGMTATFARTDAQRSAMATGYVGRWDPMRALLWALFPSVRGRLFAGRVDGLVELAEFDLATSAIGGLIGSVEDFARFVRCQLAGASPVLSAGSTRAMQAMVAHGAAGIESRLGVGLGWKHGRVADRAFLNHEGGGAGFTSELRIYPAARIGIALAMNAMRMPATMRLAHRLCEAIFARRDELVEAPR